MTPLLKVQGRELSASDLAGIGQLMAEHPQWSRWRLSRHLAVAWDWRNAAGQLKDMAARTLLLKLHQRGLVELPARRRVPINRMRLAPPLPGNWNELPIEGPLATVQPLRVREVSADPKGRRLFAEGLRQFHYLGHGGTVGENLQYMVSNDQERPLALLLFGSAAWKCQPRDHFIGWEPRQRERHLGLLTNNTRFVVLPWAKVPHLASWSLSQVMRRLSQDWQMKYGHPIVLVETFVEQPRFAGTAYRAAGLQCVGSTTGRTRQDRHHSTQAPLKDIYVSSLKRDFREVLCT
jgi:hypothetical protein